MSGSSTPSASSKWVRRAALTLLALILLAFGTVFALSRFLDPEALANWVEPRLETALGRDVEIDRVEVSLFPLGVRLRDLTVADPTGLTPALAEAASVELRVELRPLFRREARVNRFAVDGLRARLHVEEGGRTNFGDLSTRPAEGAEAEGAEAPGPEQPAGEPERGEEGRRPFVLNLRGVRLTDAEILYVDESRALSVEIADLTLRAAARQDPETGWLFVGSSEGNLTVGRGAEASLFQEVPLQVEFDVEAGEAFEDLRIRTGELRLDRIALGLSGEVAGLKDPVRRVRLELNGEGLPLADVMAALPDSLRQRIPAEAQGLLTAQLRIEGEAGPGRLPEVAGKVGLTQGRITMRGSPLAETLTADLDLRPDRSVMARVDATVLDGPFSLEGAVSLGAGGQMDLVVRADPELGGIGSLVSLPEGVTVSGGLGAQVRMVGPVGALEGLRFNGQIDPRGIEMTLPDLAVPVGLPEGRVELSGIAAILRDLPVILGEDRLSISGELGDLFAFTDPAGTPRFRGSVRGARLNLVRLSSRPLPDSSLTYGKVAFAKVGGRSLAGRTFQEAANDLGLARPEALPVAGSLEVVLDTVIDRQGRMEGVRAQVEFGPDFLRVPEATFRRYGGDLRTTANLALGAQGETPFSFSLQVTDLDAGRFLSETTPLGRFVRGRISLELGLAGTLDDLLLPDGPGLMGSGSFALTGGGLATAPLTQRLATFLEMENLREPSIQDWSAGFVLQNGRILLAESTVRGAPGTPRVGGSVGLAGELDLHSIFDLPTERLNVSALERLGVAGDILGNVARRPEVIQAVLRIGGSVFDPSIQADPRALAATLGQAVEEEVRAEVEAQLRDRQAEAERIIQEQKAEAERRVQEQREQLQGRATGFLRNLMQRQDTARVPPAPGAGVLPTRPDSIPPDTLRPDTLRPDTTRPDTVRPDTTKPDTVRPDTLRPDTVRPDTVRPDTTRPDTIGSGTPPGLVPLMVGDVRR